MLWNTLQNKLSAIKDAGRLRSLPEIQGPQGRTIFYEGLEYLNFSSNNYLGLAGDHRLRDAFIQGVQDYGVGSGAARLVNGSIEPFHRLEAALAELKGTEAALVFNSGYLANLGTLSSLLGEEDVIFSDELNHASMIDGMRLSKAKKIIYPHCDVDSLRDLLQKERLLKPDAQFLIATESVFSMDGDRCPLKELLDLADEISTFLYLDEAHATGVFGETGAGLAEEYCDHPAWSQRLIQMGTLGKALGCYGAYVAGPQVLIDYLVNCARPFIFTTALPPSLAEAVLAALRLLKERPYRRETLWQRMELFQNEWNREFPRRPIELSSPIIPLVIGEESEALALSEALKARGYWVNAIRPPTVPVGSSRLRITLMATHSEDDIRNLVQVLKEEL